MKQKLFFFFLTAFLSLIGGGELWAGSYVISYSNISEQSNVQNGSNYDYTATLSNDLTITYTRSETGKDLSQGTSPDYIKYSSNYHYTVSGIPATETITSIEFYGYANSKNSTAKIYLNNEDTGKTFVSTEEKPVTSQLVEELTLTGGFEFHVSGSESGIKITITTEETTIDNVFNDTYPYTWQFNVEAAKWTKSISQIKDNTTDWNVVTESDTDKEARNKSTSISNSTIDICKGLSFAATAGNVCLDWTNGQLWMNGTLTIPSLKVGQTITFDSNDNVTGDSKVGSTTGKVFTVTTAGDVSFTIDTYIRSIAVTKNDLTGFALNGDDVYKYNNTDYNSATKVSIGSLTFDYDAANPYLRLKLNMTENIVTGDVATNTGNYFSITESSNTDVIDITTPGIGASRAADNRVYLAGVHVLKPGTSTLTFSFAGTDSYNATTCTGTLTVNKLTPTVTFTTGTDQTIPFTTGSYTDAATATMGRTVTYVSSDEHVATVNASGVVTYVNSGVTTITATAVGDDYYNEASASYKLTLNATSTPTLAWSSIHGETNPAVTSTVAYGNKFNCYCTNTGSATVQYRSSNTDIATVEIKDGQVGETSYKYCQITPVNVGTVTITAFVPSCQGEAERSISFTLTVTKGDIGNKLFFSPNSGTVQRGYTIGPRLKFPSMLAEDIEVLSAESSDESIATVALEKNSTYLSYQNEKVDGVYPIVTGHKAGIATITVTFESDKYNSATATYTVEVVESQSWNWSEPSKEYTLYTEDFMKIPDIEGNTTGNFQLSVGSYNAANSGYVYDIKKGVITYNNKDWHRGEGVPNYTIVTDGISSPGAAKIFWCKGGDNDGAALFVFAQSAGNVKLRATDTQTGIYHDLTIHILNKTSYGTYTDPSANNKNGATYGSSGNVHTNWSENATTPFTWDFTTDFTVFDDTNCYWIDNGDGSYSLGYPTSFNYDWADTDDNGNTAGSGSNGNNESKFKAIHLKQMEGMTIYLANNDGNWHNKENKVRIMAAGTDAQGKPRGRLNINGGTFKLTVPNIPKTALASTYKVFVKAVSNGGSEPLVNIVVNGTQNSNTPTTTPGIFSADVTTGQKVELWLNNVTIYWIAFSTEANNTAKPSDNQTLTYAATSYSYGKALDLAKSEEVNSGLTAYYASSFTNGQDAASAVTLRQVTLDQNGVPANTGLVLTSGNPSTNYMIADAENQESYTAPTELSENYLVAGDGSVVNSTTGSGDGIKTNFILSWAYKKFADDGTTAMTGYQYDRDWSFYKVMPSATVPVGKAYLQVDGNLRVKPDGTIETITPSGSRRAADGSDDDRPANKLMLDIVYEDEAHGFDATTAINDVKTDTVTVDDDAWYTLQGVRVNAPARGGIYIHNGRKVVIK